MTSPSCTKQILTQRPGVLSVRELTYYMLGKFFGDQGSIRKVDPSLAFGDIAKQLHGLLREPFLTNAIAYTVRGVEERTPSLVSFSSSWVDQSLWERAAELVPVSSPVPTVEANFFLLLKNFVGDLATEVLMGRNFMEVSIFESWEEESIYTLLHITNSSYCVGLIATEQSDHLRRSLDMGRQIQHVLTGHSSLATRHGSGIPSSRACNQGDQRTSRSSLRGG